MVLPTKFEEFDEENIVKYGVSVRIAGVRDANREMRDIAIVMGAMLNLPRPAKPTATPAPAEAPAVEPAPAGGAPTSA